MSSAEAGAGKPHRALFDRGLALAGAAPGEALMVGDSPDTDVAGALALGIAAVLVDRTGTAARAGGRAPRHVAGRAPGAHRVPGVSTLELPERPEGLPPRRPGADRPWAALWAIPIAFGALVAGGLSYAAAGALRGLRHRPARRTRTGSWASPCTAPRRC